MIQLIYASYATREMSNEDLIDLLEKSRQRNSRQNITGLLLYAEKKFLQVLEGQMLFMIKKQSPSESSLIGQWDLDT